MTTAAAVFALVLAYLALVAAFGALRTLARLRRATVVLGRGGDGRETVLEAVERHVEVTTAVAERLGELETEVAGKLADVQAEVSAQLTRGHSDEARSLRNVALVRFDAFDDMAGRMSFALALLDDHGDGVTVSAIAGSTDTRLYAKGVSAGVGTQELSPEERDAVQAALGKRPADRVVRADRAEPVRRAS